MKKRTHHICCNFHAQPGCWQCVYLYSKEIERLQSLLDDKTYIQLKADYNKGHLSHAGWLTSRERAAHKATERE